MHVGGLGTLGLSLDDLLRLHAAQPHRASYRRCYSERKRTAATPQNTNTAWCLAATTPCVPRALIQISSVRTFSLGKNYPSSDSTWAGF